MAEASPTAGDGEVLTFRVTGEQFALPAGNVAEIIRPRPMTRLPHGPSALLGVINLRGTVLPVVSTAGLLGRPVQPPSATSRIVVMDRRAPVGLMVDEVAALRQPSNERLLDLDAMLARDFGALARPAAKIPDTGPAQAAEAPRTASRDVSLIGFELAGQTYGLALDVVTEVAAVPTAVAELPSTDEAMLGVAALRGSLLPLVSLRALLGLPAQSSRASTARLLVSRIGTAPVGLVVDRLTEILRIPPDAIDPVPPVLRRGKGEAQIEAICRLEGGRRLISILAPARLFDQETAARVLAEAQQGDADMSGDQGRGGALEQFVVFQLGSEHYGLPIAAVDEVVRPPDRLTRVPGAPPFIQGVMNLRGKLVPVIDQGDRFASQGQPDRRGRRIVIVTLGGLRAGFLVDGVSEVLSVGAEHLTAVPELTVGEARVFDRVATLEHDGRLILLVDPQALLDRAERDMVAAVAEAAAKAEAQASPAS